MKELLTMDTIYEVPLVHPTYTAPPLTIPDCVQVNAHCMLPPSAELDVQR